MRLRLFAALQDERRQRNCETTHRSRLIWYFILAAISGLYVLFCAYVPISIRAELIHDDALFISHAQLLAGFHWLGPFSEFTLMKGPGYPVFLALSARSGLPISVTQAIFNCLAVGAFAWVAGRLTGSRALGFLLFSLVLWNPGLVTLWILRQAIYPAQLLLFLAALSYALFCAYRIESAILWSSIAGLILGWFWLTREESFWILPAVTLLVFGCGLGTWLRSRTLRQPTIAIGCLGGAFVVVLFGFRTANLIAYGSFVGVDTKEANFVGAMEALESVQVGKPIAFLPMPAAARREVYAVSPAFASLRPYLDPPGGSLWQKFGCAAYPDTCGDLGGQGWFMWALRDAASQAGNYKSPRRAAAFFHDLRDQVRTVCRQGRLVCASSPIPFVPRITEQQARKIPHSLETALSILSLWAPPPLTEGPDTGDPAKASAFWRFLNRPIRPPVEPISIAGELSTRSDQSRGWLEKQVSDIANISPPDACFGYFDSAVPDGFEGGARVDGWAWSTKEKAAPSQILLVDITGTVIGLAASGMDRPDVVAAKFGVTDPRTGWRGYSKEGRAVTAYALIDGDRQVCRLTGSFDLVSATYENHLVGIGRVLYVRSLINHLYAVLMPLLLGLGLVAISISVSMGGGRRIVADPALLLAVVIWLLLLSEITTILITDVFLFHSMNYSYLASAYPLSCIAPLLSIWTAVQCLTSDSVAS